MAPGDHSQPQVDLRAVLDNMSDVFFRTDGQGRIVMVSRGVEALLGWPPDELVGRMAAEFCLDPAQCRTTLRLIAADGGRLRGHDLSLRRRDGGSVWVSVSARRLSEAEGGGMEGILHDVSDRRRAERQQRERGALVQALLNATSDATMLIDGDGTLLACNKVFADRFEQAVEELVGRDLFALFPPELAERRRMACLEVLRTGETTVLRDQRDGRHLMNTITAVPNGDGPPLLAVFSRDVTQEVEDKQRIEEQMATIRRSNEELEQFAYVASHDLREPLRQISSYIGLIERRSANNLDDEAREFLAFVRNGAQRMDALILDLLAFSRMARPAGEMHPLPLVQPVEQALALLAPPPGSVEVEVAADLGVRGDHGQLARLFQNLIGNGLKYHAPDRPPRLRVWAERRGNMVAVSVADNGIGIEEQHFDRIFRIFQRLHGPDKYDGTGIGLAIVKRVAENHGGSVTVASTPGQGSTFTVTLPLAQ